MKYGCSSLGVVLFVGLLVFGSAGSEPEGRLFPEVPVVDLVVMTPMWPTNSGGPRFMTLGNHVAGGIASDGRYLYVSDACNNRVLVFDLEDLTDRSEPVKVIGQKDMFSRVPSDDLYGLNHPQGLATDGRWLFIADTGNLRLLAYDLTNFEVHPILVFCSQVTDIAFDGEHLYTVANCGSFGGRSVVVYPDIVRFLEGEGPLKDLHLMSEGEPSANTGLPSGIDVDDRYLYVADGRRVLIWDKHNLRDHAPADFVIGFYDFECRDQVEDLRGRLTASIYDVASNGRYIFVPDGGRVLVFERKKLSNGMLATYVIGKKDFEDLQLDFAPSKDFLTCARGLAADEGHLYVTDKGFYHPAVLAFDLSKLENGMEADCMLGVWWPRNPKYGLEIVDNKLFVAGQEYIGVFEQIPSENYRYPDWYILSMGGVDVSSDGRYLCIISKGGAIGIYDGVPDEDGPPDVKIDIPGVTGGGAATGLCCRDGKLVACNSFWEQSKVLVWKSVPTEDDQKPDVVLTMAGGERIMEPFTAFIYGDTLFVGVHIGSKVLIYKSIERLTDETEPDLILGESEGIRGGVHDVFYDGRYLFISAGQGLYIYHGLPEERREPDEVITEVDVSGTTYRLDPWGIYFDGKNLWVMNGCSEDYSFVMRIPKSRTEPVHPEKLMSEEFAEYLESGEVPEFMVSLWERYSGIHREMILSGDFDGNGVVDFKDFSLFVAHFGTSHGEPNFDPLFDLTGDGRVDFEDFFKFVAQFDKGGSAKAGTRPKLSAEVRYGDLGPVVEVRAEGAEGFGLVLNYDPEAYEFLRADVSSRLPVLKKETRGKLAFACVGDKAKLVFRGGFGGAMEVEEAVVVDRAYRVSDAGVRGTLIVPEFALGRNFPNPFNSSTAVVYTLPEAAHVKLVVYDLLGRVVKVLVNGVQDAGRHRTVWDGRDNGGSDVASGVYLVRMEAGGFNKVRKVVLVR